MEKDKAALDDSLLNEAHQAERPEQKVETTRYADLVSDKSYFWHYLITAAAIVIITYITFKEKPLGRLVNVEGRVVASQLANTINNVKTEVDIYKGDYIQTLQGKAEFIYSDGTSISIAPNSHITLNEIQGRKLLYLEDGKFTADVRSQEKGKEMEVKTKSSKAFILEARFVLDSKEGKSELEVFEGKVHFHNTTGSEDFVIGGEIAQAKHDRPVISRKKTISEQKIK